MHRVCCTKCFDVIVERARIRRTPNIAADPSPKRSPEPRPATFFAVGEKFLLTVPYGVQEFRLTVNRARLVRRRTLEVRNLKRRVGLPLAKGRNQIMAAKRKAKAKGKAKGKAKAKAKGKAKTKRKAKRKAKK